MRKFWNILGIIFIVGFITMCTASIIISDNNAEKICNETHYFKVINKDYTDTGNSIVSNNYNYVMYFNRYDENKKIIESRYDLNKITITKYEYDNLEVGIMYHKSKVNTKTCGYN